MTDDVHQILKGAKPGFGDASEITAAAHRKLRLGQFDGAAVEGGPQIALCIDQECCGRNVATSPTCWL